REGEDVLWVFDPIDGTSGMIRLAMSHAYQVAIHGVIPAFGITIAAIAADDSATGVVAELRPQGNRLEMPRGWVGIDGVGTTCNGTPVQRHFTRPLFQATLASTVPEVMFTTRGQWGQFQALFESTRSFLPDQNCIGFMNLIDGTVDVVLEADLTLPDA